MRAPDDPPDNFRLPPKPTPKPATPSPEQVRQSEFEKDDWLPDGVRRRTPEKPETNDLVDASLLLPGCDLKPLRNRFEEVLDLCFTQILVDHFGADLVYSLRKTEWCAANPGASPAEYEQACQRIAAEVGI